LGVGKGSRGDLRYCIEKANNLPGPDVVDFRVTGAIDLTKALPELRTDMQLQAPQEDTVTIRRTSGGEYRIFTVLPGANVMLTNLTISNGRSEIGGGILNHGTLVLARCTVTGNTASGLGTAFGGGVASTGPLTVIESTIAANWATANDAGAGIIRAEGGGIYVAPPASSVAVSIVRSTVSDNSALAFGVTEFAELSTVIGGGLSIYNATVSIEGSTIARNVTDNRVTSDCPFGCQAPRSIGGGLWVKFVACDIRGSTIAQNSALGSDPDALKEGGGINRYPQPNYPTTVSLQNTIVATNRADVGPDVHLSIISLGHNLIGDGSGASGFAPTDLVGDHLQAIDPKLNDLNENGGPTQTMALKPGSLALDAGDNTGAPAWDQRGSGFPRIVNGTIDMGAFEVQATEFPVLELHRLDPLSVLALFEEDD
jgi:hypothetical protein